MTDCFTFFLFFIYWRFSINLTFRKHLNFHILGFTCTCVSSTGKGEKSQLAHLKHSFSKDFQILQILFWNWPCARPSNWDLVLSWSILKNNPHIPSSICSTLHCVLCMCVYKYGNIHRKFPCGFVRDLMRFFSCQNIGSEVLQCYQKWKQLFYTSWICVT